MRLRDLYGAFSKVGMLCSAAALLFSTQQAVAQPVQGGAFPRRNRINMQLFRPAIDTKGYVTLNASQVLGHLDFSLGLVGTWAGRFAVAVSAGRRDASADR